MKLSVPALIAMLALSCVLSLGVGLTGCGEKKAPPTNSGGNTPGTGSGTGTNGAGSGTSTPPPGGDGTPSGNQTQGSGTPKPETPGTPNDSAKGATPTDANAGGPAATPDATPGAPPVIGGTPSSGDKGATPDPKGTPPGGTPSATATPPAPDSHPAHGKRLYRVAMIARTQSSLAANAARAGAEDAAADLSTKLGIELKLVWQTPAKDDPVRQAAILEQAVSSGVQGVILSSSDAGVLTSAVEFAHDRGVPVICFESDAPGSSAFVGADEERVGRAVAQDLAQAMSEKGAIAVLAGDSKDAVAQARLRGLKLELESYPNIKLSRTVSYAGADEGAMNLEQTKASSPDINGWAILGPWPNLTEADVEDIARTAKIVAADAFPQQLKYVRGGQVQSLVAQDYYAWGYESVRLLAARLTGEKGSSAPGPRTVEIDRVTKGNAEEMEGKWGRWLKGIGK